MNKRLDNKSLERTRWNLRRSTRRYTQKQVDNMRLIITVLIACFLVACSDVKELKFTKDNHDQVMEKVRKSKDLTGEEVGLLMAALMRTTFSGRGLEGETVGKLIEEQRKIAATEEAKDKEEKRLAEEAAKKVAQVAAELSKYIVVAPFEKSFRKADWRIDREEVSDRIDIAFVFENKSNRNIKAFKGEMVFKDVFGETIEKRDLMYDEGIKAGQKMDWNGSMIYEGVREDQRKFRDTVLDNMKFEWKPKTIIFDDGSKIGIEN
jgi:hypothetical protein